MKLKLKTNTILLIVGSFKGCFLLLMEGRCLSIYDKRDAQLFPGFGVKKELHFQGE